jgi:molybdopterin converting factor subunit 1
LHVEVLLFARAREICGGDQVDLQLVDGATVSDCFAQLAADAPALELMRERLLVAVNECYAAWDTRLSDGDVVAMIPPVSGG